QSSTSPRPRVPTLPTRRRTSRASSLPYTTLFRSSQVKEAHGDKERVEADFVGGHPNQKREQEAGDPRRRAAHAVNRRHLALVERDRKSTRLNSSHVKISYAVFCLKTKTSSSPTPS